MKTLQLKFLSVFHDIPSIYFLVLTLMILLFSCLDSAKFSAVQLKYTAKEVTLTLLLTSNSIKITVVKYRSCQ